MKVVNIQEAKTHLSRLVEQAHAGQEVCIGKHGKPMACLVAYAPRQEPRPLGGLPGIRIREDFDDEDARIEALFGGAE